MTKSRVIPGFTLVEILASVAIFASVIGILFSALAAMQRTDLFRRDNQAVAQAANFAFEPIIQSLKEADAKQTVKTKTGACVTVQGYYATTKGGEVASDALLKGKMHSFQDGNGVLVVITSDPSFKADKYGLTRTWIRRDYYVETLNNIKIKGENTAINVLMEKTYKPKNDYVWPAPLRSGPTACELASFHWEEAFEDNGSKKELTARDVTVKNFAVSLVHATLPPTGTDAPIEQRAPFITVSLTVEKPGSKFAKPVTLRTTLTPTFSYGEIREN